MNDEQTIAQHSLFAQFKEDPDQTTWPMLANA